MTALHNTSSVLCLACPKGALGIQIPGTGGCQWARWRTSGPLMHSADGSFDRHRRNARASPTWTPVTAPSKTCASCCKHLSGQEPSVRYHASYMKAIIINGQGPRPRSTTALMETSATQRWCPYTADWDGLIAEILIWPISRPIPSPQRMRLGPARTSPRRLMQAKPLIYQATSSIVTARGSCQCGKRVVRNTSRMQSAFDIVGCQFNVIDPHSVWFNLSSSCVSVLRPIIRRYQKASSPGLSIPRLIAIPSR